MGFADGFFAIQRGRQKLAVQKQEADIRRKLADAKLKAFEFAGEKALRIQEDRRLFLQRAGQLKEGRAATGLLEQDPAQAGFSLDPQSREELQGLQARGQGILEQQRAEQDLVPESFTLNPGQTRFRGSQQVVTAPGALGTSPQARAFQDLVNQGMQPLEALQQVSGATKTPTTQNFGSRLESIASTRFGKRFEQLQRTDKATVRAQGLQEGLAEAAARAGQKPLEGSIAKQFVDLDSSVDLANEIFTLSEGAFTGPVAARKGSVASFFGKAPAKQVQFRRAVSDLKDFIKRLRSGQAITASEEKSIGTFLPTLEDAPITFKNKLIGLQRQLIRVRDRVVSVASASRGNLGALATRSAFDISIRSQSFPFRGQELTLETMTNAIIDSMTADELRAWNAFVEGT